MRSIRSDRHQIGSYHLNKVSLSPFDDKRYIFSDGITSYAYGHKNIIYYYMEESVLLGTKPLVDSIRHFIRDPSGVFSVCHLCECRIVQ